MHGILQRLPFTDVLAQLITNLLPHLSSVCASLADYRWLYMIVTPYTEGCVCLPAPLSLGWPETTSGIVMVNLDCQLNRI